MMMYINKMVSRVQVCSEKISNLEMRTCFKHDMGFMHLNTFFIVLARMDEKYGGVRDRSRHLKGRLLSLRGWVCMSLWAIIIRELI